MKYLLTMAEILADTVMGCCLCKTGYTCDDWVLFPYFNNELV